MIYYSGGSYGDPFVSGVAPAQWHAAASIFLLAELSTVPVMAWFIHLACRLNGLIYHGVYALFGMRDDLKALQMATVISGAGLLMWLLLLQIVLVQG